MKIIAIKDFLLDNRYYFIGNELDYNKIGKINLIKLKEKGFIETLDE